MNIKIPKTVQEKILNGMPTRQRGIVRAHFNGSSPEQIAEDLNFSLPQVKVVLSDIATYVAGAPKPKVIPKSKTKAKKIDTLKKAFNALDKRDNPANELEGLVPRAMEIIAAVLHSDKLNATQIDTAFKVLNRTGLHEKREELGGNKSLTVISYAPLPGQDPTLAIERAKKIEIEEQGK